MKRRYQSIVVMLATVFVDTLLGADGQRASRTVNGITTAYFGHMLAVDNDNAGTKRWLYMFNGQPIA